LDIEQIGIKSNAVVLDPTAAKRINWAEFDNLPQRLVEYTPCWRTRLSLSRPGSGWWVHAGPLRITFANRRM